MTPTHVRDAHRVENASQAAAADAHDSAGDTLRDGRRTHVIDRAADYVILADQGMTVARIARRRRKSTAYVSVLLRLGRALQGLEPHEREALRSPRITWSLVQRIVRGDTDVISLRSQLRAALGGFSTHNVDGRKHRVGRTRAAAPVVGVAWAWDAAWFDRDPLGYAAAHIAHLTSVHRAVQSRIARAIARGGHQEGLAVGQSLRTLQRAIATAALPPALTTPTNRVVLATFAILERQLAVASAEIAALVGDDSRVPARPVVRHEHADEGEPRSALQNGTTAHAHDDGRVAVTADELEEDLFDR